jgi:methylmalonyl-CoA mutase
MMRRFTREEMAMAEESPDLPLAAEFPEATREQWLRLVDEVLKGASFDRKLVASTYDRLSIEPLYARAAAKPLAARSPGSPWQVSQRIDHPDPAVANAEALHELDGGATGLSLIFVGSVGSHGYGLEAAPVAIARVLEGLQLDAGVAVELDLGGDHNAVGDALAAIVRQQTIAPAAARIRFGFDPIGEVTSIGQSPWPLAQLSAHLVESVGGLAAKGFNGPFAVADGRIVHNAGGSEGQELAYVLAVGVAYLRAFERDFALDNARRLIFFRLAADADQYLTMAKFRALRKLWARVEATCGLSPEPIFISAETAWRMMTKRDPWVNMLRATMAVFSAGLGGANSISVLPYTAALGLPDRFARRVARNTQLILLEESNLARVLDPAAGAGVIEDLTQKLCTASWALFQEFERLGGALAALEQGLIQRQVAATRAERQAAIAHRKDPLTGTSEFPDLEEAPVSVLDVAPVVPAQSAPAAVNVAAMPSIRLAEPFERLRDASDRILQETGARPRVFLANLGRLADFNARAMFAKSFFAVGGIEALTDEGFVSASQVGQAEVRTDLAALAAAFKAAGTLLACVCSSDQIYAREAVAAIKALSAAGARYIYVAGRPPALLHELEAAGVRTFIYVGCNVLATLQEAYQFVSS